MNNQVLPGVLRQIADVAGEDAALAIAKARGGTQVYFPPVPDADHWLSHLIGHDRAQAVCYELTCGVGSLRLDIPVGPLGRAAQGKLMVDSMLREGRSERDIALATGYTARGVRKRRAGLDDGQGSLF